MGSRKRNSKKKAPESRWQSLLKKPWIFAGAAFGLDLAMLIAGMVLSAAKLPVEYTASGASVRAYRAYHRRSVPEKAPGGSDNGSRRTSHSVAGDGGKLGVYGARLPGQGKIQRELLRRGAAANNRGNRAVFRRVHRGFLPHRDRGRRKGGAPRRHRPQ